ncbi:expressed unknown protein [Seminavis robusta]|uniref:Uncharacterized protein n=1 Tax=Seminavis robusta TaxID=568900 RepID=A0A9N8DNX9_9STRA|nr:expressed unknown protein [Seminavis robusta]|eukprot:Sro244_g097170.1 n/a (236) ;mRNA; f:37021-37728
MVARQARSLLDNNSASKASLPNGTVHKRSTNGSKCQVAASYTVKAKVNTGTLSACKPDSAPLKKRILASFTQSNDNNTAEPLSQRKPQPVEDWNMPPPAPRNPRLSQSAPTSPLGGLVKGSATSRQQLKSADGAPHLGPIPLLRKRSESMGSDLLSGTSGSRRVVSFAPRAEPASMDVAVELESPGLGEESDDFRGTQSRARSASCHVLSTNQQSGVACGTIYEEIGHSAGCMDE